MKRLILLILAMACAALAGCAGRGVAAVAKWALALEVEQAPLDETETPNNYAGGAAWHFNVNNGELTFSYADYGEGAIFINNEWYAVKSPSDPPVNE